MLDGLVADKVALLAQPFVFWADASDAGPQDSVTFDWDLDGDGQYDDLSETPGAGPQSSAGLTSSRRVRLGPSPITSSRAETVRGSFRRRR